MTEPFRYAPGWPGIPPRWTTSAKTGLGTSLRAASRVWFTLSHGILNEVYYPRVDQACLRDLGMIVTDGHGFFSEEKRDTISATTWIEPGVPAFRLLTSCRSGRYRIEKEIVTDPPEDGDWSVLAGLPKLQKVNGMPAAEFLRKKTPGS